MITDTSFKTFCEEYLNDARKIAINQLAGFKKKSTYWNYKLDDEAICEDSVTQAMEKVYEKFDPSQGNLHGLLKTVIHNEMYDIIKAEANRLSKNSGFDSNEEPSWAEMASGIPDSAMSHLKETLIHAIGNLGPMDQAILWFYLEDPKTYIQESASLLGIKKDNVSLRKNRALEKIRALMNMTRSDYHDMFEEQPHSFTTSHCLRYIPPKLELAPKPMPELTNFECPEFNLETLATRIADIIRKFKGEI